ncbi:MAG: winged helix-turn-helix domain-containing protein [Candidatus Methanomethylicaceae archaeon]
MPIPSQKEIQIPLLHLIHTMGGQVRPGDVYDILANYFALTENERQQLQPSGARKFDNIVRWSRNYLCKLGFLDRSTYGIWKITEKGRKELSRLGLIDKPFPRGTSSQNQRVGGYLEGAKEAESDDEEILQLILEKIAPNGPRRFPEDFLDSNCSDFYEVELPGMQLHLAPLSQTIITSPKGYFRYEAKNPPEAKYILYAHKVGLKKVKIPTDNLTLFKVVKAYEKYCEEIIKRSFELALEFTYDEHRAETLVNEIANKLNLRTKMDNE